MTSRVVYQTDGVAWLEQATLAGCAVVTSLPDHTELNLGFEGWRSWFVEVSALICRKLDDDAVAIFYQTDVKHDGRQVDKGYLVSRGAEIAGSHCLFHKVACRVPAGRTTFGRPSYAHLVCFSRSLRLLPGQSTPDVLPQLGEMLWPRAIGLDACETIIRLFRNTPPVARWSTRSVGSGRCSPWRTGTGSTRSASSCREKGRRRRAYWSYRSRRKRPGAGHVGKRGGGMTGEALMAALHLACPPGTALVERLGVIESPAKWGIGANGPAWDPSVPDLRRELSWPGGGMATCTRLDGVRHGPAIGWAERLLYAGGYADGLRDGTWVQLDPMDSTWQAESRRPRVISTWRMTRGTGVERWREYGRRHVTVSYVDGRLDGPFRLYQGPGPPVTTGSYRHGCRDGTWRFYRQVWWYNFYNPLREPRLEQSITWRDGLLDGPTRYHRDPRGWGEVRHLEGQFTRGVPDGAWLAIDDEGEWWSQLHMGVGVLNVTFNERYGVGAELTAREDTSENLWLPPGRYRYRVLNDRVMITRRHGRCPRCAVPALADVAHLGVQPIDHGILIDVGSWADIGHVVAILDGVARGPDATIRVVPAFVRDPSSVALEPKRACVAPE